MTRNTLLLDRSTVEAYAEPAAVVDAVEQAFAAAADGDAIQPAKSYVELPQYNGDFRSMPAYLDAGEWDAAGVKWVNVHPDNPADHDLPTVMGTMLYADPETGVPLAILDGTALTMARTGAAAAVATKYLAREDASSLGLVGAGAQSYSQLEAIATVRAIDEVVVADQDDERVAAFLERYDGRFDVREGDVADAVASDVVSTVTPVREPIVDRAAVGEHTHVNAIGADAPGKHELADDLLTAATIVIDDHEQCTHSGEINVPYAEGVLTDADIHAELGDVVVGDAPGRTDETGITVFDSTGLAIQDLAAAHVVYEHALEGEEGRDVDLYGLA
ncbi:ornithine cyclodeaminase family protein [Natrarchaeobaculum aegyptiacum]|uniref:Alanine dehydrogenase n=1 Tax=Natrarchaeobaculum aegyptiacum TaxID=745377 RepID=A0A2Z2HR00_9EURY|nr:ornithine cyclodeaminase family protein [Natrarchaeobaculum aegyptiacum]ARS89580.1 ornithine cyclodeaminase family protein [Natrarchaeobaculum aegyptiacum]